MTTDKFIPAVQELGEAISAGEPVRTALAEIAKEHGLEPAALRRRAVRALGQLGTYRRRNTKVAATVAEATRERREIERKKDEFAARGVKVSTDTIKTYVRFMKA